MTSQLLDAEHQTYLTRRGDVWSVEEPGFLYYMGDAEGCLAYLERKGLAR